MSNILDRILATKRDEVAAAKVARPLALLRAEAEVLAAPRDFIGAIRARHLRALPAVIAEIKRASPSQGVMKAELDPAAVAASYERAGAACLSVLTDSEYFQGRVEDLVAARAACQLPVLRKDFLVDSYQVWEARAMGADCILLISGATPLVAMQEMADLAMSLGMAVLVESHSAEQLQDALTLATPLIGLNNRDLTRFETDLGVTERLKPAIPDDRIVVTESGIRTPADVRRLQAAGVQTFLVGGAFMTQPDPGEALRGVFPHLGN